MLLQLTRRPLGGDLSHGKLCMQITRDNHFVPQSYLKRWADDDQRIWCYRLLVSHERIPIWRQRPVRGVAYASHLYTHIRDGSESDEFERWLEVEFEIPAYPAIEKVIHGQTLSNSDLHRLAFFMVAQDVRTPQNYIECMRRWEVEVPQLLQKTLIESVRRIEEAQKTGEVLKADPERSDSPFAELLKVSVGDDSASDNDRTAIRAELSVGRRLWIETQRHLLSKTAKIALDHSWSIVEAVEGLEWFTTDDPVVCLNYYANGSYDLRGGWGNLGTNLFMPLSPHHMLFTEVGQKTPAKFQFTVEQNHLIRRVQAEGAHRTIFADRKISEIERIRPRTVDSEAFTAEQNAWKEWHQEQSLVESNGAH